MQDLSEHKIPITNAIRSLYQLIMIIDVPKNKGTIIDCNKELEYLGGYSEYDSFCGALYTNIHPEDRDEFLSFSSSDNIPDSLMDSIFTSMECRIRHEGGAYFWSEITFCSASEEDRAGGNEYLLLIRDIHAIKTTALKKEAEDRQILCTLQDKYDSLFEENMTDQQTGCYNRKGLKYYSELVIKEAAETGKYLFVCVADLNGLKYMNDTYGHAAGDEAISVVSSVLLKASPEGSRIVRTGGDEFLMFAAIEKDSPEPQEMDEMIKSSLNSYNRTHNNPYEIGVSYGWTTAPCKNGMTDLDEYIETADKLMYEMKAATDKHRR